MTVEELDAELAFMQERTRRMRERMIAEYTEQLATETNPYHREYLQRSLDEIRARLV